jgi:hypothetical protein
MHEVQVIMNKATRTLCSTFGVIVGLIGIVYGVFEILQGNAPSGSFIIDAVGNSKPLWPGGALTAVTVISSMLVTGIVAIFASLLVIVWAIWFIPLKYGGFVFMLLAIEQLLVGGGIGQIILAFLIWLLATRINAPLTWWRTRPSAQLKRILAGLWPAAFTLSAALYGLHIVILLIIGLFGSFLGATDLNLGLIAGYAAIVPFIVAAAAGLARDSNR